jgi:hypothetical protein
VRGPGSEVRGAEERGDGSPDAEQLPPLEEGASRSWAAELGPRTPLYFGIIAATIEIAIILALIYC